MREPTAAGAGAGGDSEAPPAPTAGATSAVLVAPDGVGVAERPGGCGVLKAKALTLKAGPSGVELYAALRNEGDSPACGSSFSVELFDASGQSLAAGVGGLLVKRFFRLANGSDTAACLAPGDESLLALRDLSLALPPEAVGRVEYWCNYWALEVEPLGSLELRDLKSVPAPDGASFTGVLQNGLPAPLPSPAVAVFPLDAVGRPLGVAYAEAAGALPPGDTWTFHTDAVTEPGVSLVAYPTRGP